MRGEIMKRFSFTKEDREKLQNIEIGIINAGATMDGLFFYKNALLNNAYKRLDIVKDVKDFTKTIRYNLAENIIEYTLTPIKKEKKVAKK